MTVPVQAVYREAELDLSDPVPLAAPAQALRSEAELDLIDPEPLAAHAHAERNKAESDLSSPEPLAAHVQTGRGEAKSKSDLRCFLRLPLPLSSRLSLLALFARELALGETSPDELRAGFERGDVRSSALSHLRQLRPSPERATVFALDLLRTWPSEGTDRQKHLAEKVLATSPRELDEAALNLAAESWCDRAGTQRLDLDVLELSARVRVYREWLARASGIPAHEVLQLFAKYSAQKLIAATLVQDASVDAVFAASCVFSGWA